MLPIKAYHVKALLQGSIVESSPHVFDNPRWGVGHLLMTGSYDRVLNACFINLHSWCEIAPYPVPATCRVIQSARSRLHGHAKAKRDRASGRARVVEATKEHYLAWRDTMGRQRAGPGGSILLANFVFASVRHGSGAIRMQNGLHH